MLLISLAPDKVYYEPLDWVFIDVQVGCFVSSIWPLDLIEHVCRQISSDVSAYVKALEFHASGMERTDLSWTSKLWRPEFKPETMENRVCVSHVPIDPCVHTSHAGAHTCSAN